MKDIMQRWTQVFIEGVLDTSPSNVVLLDWIQQLQCNKPPFIWEQSLKITNTKAK